MFMSPTIVEYIKSRSGIFFTLKNKFLTTNQFAKTFKSLSPFLGMSFKIREASSAMSLSTFAISFNVGINT